MANERQVLGGSIGITRDETLRAYLQTCCGILYYDRTGLNGLAHAVVPSEFERWYSEGSNLSSDFIATPGQAAETLLEEMVKHGANRDNLRAGIFGCQQHEIGYGNALEAEEVISSLKIQIARRVTATPYDLDIILGPTNILVRVIDPNTRSHVNNIHLSYF